MPNIDSCQVNIPHKKWSGNPLEEQNYLEIERWSRRIADCFGSCTCSVEGWVSSFTADDGITNLVDRPSVTTALCGTTDPAHISIITANLNMEGNASGARDFRIYGEGESSGAWGMTLPGAIGQDGSQSISLTRIFPAHINTVNPHYTFIVWQNSGSNLHCSITVTEYYPCCNCDWSFPC